MLVSYEGSMGGTRLGDVASGQCVRLFKGDCAYVVTDRVEPEGRALVSLQSGMLRYSNRNERVVLLEAIVVVKGEK